MFGLISTKDLYIVELDEIVDCRYGSSTLYWVANNPKYFLARKEDDDEYIDIFTGTTYGDDDIERGRLVITHTYVVDIPKKNIKKSEALYMLNSIREHNSKKQDKVKTLKNE